MYDSTNAVPNEPVVRYGTDNAEEDCIAADITASKMTAALQQLRFNKALIQIKSGLNTIKMW